MPAPNGKSKLVRVIMEQIHHADGTIVLRPINVAPADDMITLREASALTGLSIRRLSYLCEIGDFKTAHKPGHGINAHWRIARAEAALRQKVDRD